MRECQSWQFAQIYKEFSRDANWLAVQRAHTYKTVLRKRSERWVDCDPGPSEACG
jgi:hypothetical protein